MQRRRYLMHYVNEDEPSRVNHFALLNDRSWHSGIYTTATSEAQPVSLVSHIFPCSRTCLWPLSQYKLHQMNKDIHCRSHLDCQETPSEIAPFIAFSGISGFNSGVRTFSFPAPEFIDYP